MTRGRLTIDGYEKDCDALRLMHDETQAQRDRHSEEEQRLGRLTVQSAYGFLGFIIVVCFLFVVWLIEGAS